MSKQDRQGVRTATDLERKYGFGQSFAEIYNLAADARSAAEAAKDAVSDLDSTLTSEEIFLRLTGGGTGHGVYRSSDGKLYVNADYIMSGTLKADKVKVEAATIYGKLDANKADISELTVNAAKISGKLTASQIDAANLKVSAANITGLLSASNIDVDNLYVSAANVSGTISAGNISIGGLLEINEYDGGDTCGYIGATKTLSGLLGGLLCDATAYYYLVATTGGVRMSAYDYCNIYVLGGDNEGCYSSHTIKVASDRRLKNSVVYGLDEYEDLFMRLKPCSFALNNEKVSKRHWGLIAQDVKQETDGLSEPVALVGYDGEHYSVAYGEITSLNTYMIQKLMARVDELEKKLEA